jgi:amidase
MAVQVPTPRQVSQVAEEMGLSLTEADVQSFINLMRPSIAAYNVVDAMPDNLPPVKYPRTPGKRPAPEENKYNAWYHKTTVNGASQASSRARRSSSRTTSCWPACR